MSTTRIANEITATFGPAPRAGTKAHARWTQRAIRYCVTGAANIRELNVDHEISSFRDLAFGETAELEQYAAILGAES